MIPAQFSTVSEGTPPGPHGKSPERPWLGQSTRMS